MMAEPLREYRIKDHARFEMKRRQITEEQVRQVLAAPVYRTSKIAKYWR